MNVQSWLQKSNCQKTNEKKLIKKLRGSQKKGGVVVTIVVAVVVAAVVASVVVESAVREAEVWGWPATSRLRPPPLSLPSVAVAVGTTCGSSSPEHLNYPKSIVVQF